SAFAARRYAWTRNRLAPCSTKIFATSSSRPAISMFGLGFTLVPLPLPLPLAPTRPRRRQTSPFNQSWRAVENIGQPLGTTSPLFLARAGIHVGVKQNAVCSSAVQALWLAVL